ncbi:MAG: putative EF-hand domain-containing protein, partial [Streblomastix strix]
EFRHEFDTRLADQCEVDDEINPYLGWSRKNIEWGTIAQGEKARVRAFRGEAPLPSDIGVQKQTIPSFIAYDKIVMAFLAYYKEPVHESQEEVYRVRSIEIDFHLEDGTMCLLEHKQENSGIPQGTYLKRHPIPKDENNPDFGFISLNDLDIGKDINIYGRVFHIYDANGSTREYLSKFLNRQLKPAETKPYDEHAKKREQIESHIRITIRDPDTKLQKFLRYDRNVLRFNGYWEDVEVFGDQRFFAIHYFLSDGTMEVLELRKVNSGYEAFPTFIKRQLVPKDGSAPLAMTDGQIWDCYKDQDLGIGKEITVYGRKLLLYDCDEFTQDWYRKKYGVQDFTPVDLISIGAVEPPILSKEKIRGSIGPDGREREIPPHLGFGQELDALSTCFHLQPRVWPRDVYKLLVRDKDQYHFLCRFETKDKGEAQRRFVLTFFLNDNSISVFEPQQRNIGNVTGKYIQRAKIYKPDSNVYYGPQDFYVGAVINLREKQFVLLDCDKHTFRTQRELGYPPPDYARIEAEYRLRLNDPFDARNLKQALDKLGRMCTLEEFKHTLDEYQLGPSELEMQALAIVQGANLTIDEGKDGEKIIEGKGEEIDIDIDKFKTQLTEGQRIQDGSLFRSNIPVLVHTVPHGATDIKPFPNATRVSFGSGAQDGTRNALLKTNAVSLQASDAGELTATTKGGLLQGGNLASVQRHPKASPSIVMSVPHSAGNMSGGIKRSLLEGETEKDFRLRLKRERAILVRTIERINLKHPSYTEAYQAFTLKQSSRLPLLRFQQQIIKYGITAKTSEFEILVNHFFGDQQEIGYEDFLRAMNVEDNPLSFEAAIAPDRTQ